MADTWCDGFYSTTWCCIRCRRRAQGIALRATSTATTAGDGQDMPLEHAAATESSEWQEVPPGREEACSAGCGGCWGGRLPVLIDQSEGGYVHAIA
jgi:hypothetical protein